MSSKIICCQSYSQLSSLCLDISMKHCLSGLIYYIFVFSLVQVSIEKIYQTLKAVFKHISKHLKLLQNTPLRVVFSTLFPGVWKCVQTRSFRFHILPGFMTKTIRSILKTHNLHSEIYLLLTNSTYWQNYFWVKSIFFGVLSDLCFCREMRLSFLLWNVVC